MFTKEELEEMAKADAEIEEEFVMTQEEIEASRRRDRDVKLDRMDNRERKITAGQKAYYEANREKIAAERKAKREEKKLVDMGI